MKSLYGPVKPDFEERLLGELSSDVPWALVERFSRLERVSSGEGERQAAEYIAARLREFGVEHEVYEPELYLSVPLLASLEVDGKPVRAKATAFSAGTGPEGVSGEAVYVSAWASEAPERLFEFTYERGKDVRGKIVVTDGFGFPGPVRFFETNGAIGQVHINPGENIHWGFCNSVWGAPDLDSEGLQPQTPVISISRPDGEALLKRLKKGKATVTIRTEMKEGWYHCPVIVAEIEGKDEPERFVLAHGHYDSWAVGVGDNAVGDATLLELARIFHKHRDGLARTLKVAWWSGHSTGRYAGSTWFADTFGLELARDCIAQVDIDSPGCRWATEYSGVSSMPEAEDLCIQTILDATRQGATTARPPQAGDYSFNNIGISSFFMLLSTMPKELREEKGYYPVGGCGGNIGWHSEHDTLEIADRDILMRDLSIYATSLQRVLNNPIHPFDFRKVAAEFRDKLNQYANGAADEVKFDSAFDALEGFEKELDALYGKIPGLLKRPVTDPGVRAANDAMLELARILVPINYTRSGRFRTEPAVHMPPLPDLGPALDMREAAGHDRKVLRTHLLRGLNRVTWAIEGAAGVVQRANTKIVEG